MEYMRYIEGVLSNYPSMLPSVHNAFYPIDLTGPKRVTEG